ncbi:hypothetical protein [Micromonospora zamorensis]|uniref:hypothetical protein n=1 Tax=Micromonospora zamorensis TaxID=709883 RepID=UPI0033B6F62B
MGHTLPTEPTPTDPVEPPPPPAAVSQVNPVQLPEWMRSSQTEHQPTGWDRVRFFSARHNGALLVGLGLVLALLMVVGGMALVGRITGGGGASASASPTPPLSRVGEPRDLFAGSPAASFTPAEEAVRMPAAKGTGPFSESQVRTSLEAVRKALVQSRIDTSMFMGDPEPFLRLLAPDAREQLRSDFSNNSFLRYATRMASPSEWEPGARADGRVSYRATKANDIRVLEVSTEFVWAYPFVHEQFWVAEVHRDQIPAGDPGTIFDLDAPAPTTTRC